MMNLQQISFAIPAPQFEALRRRAGTLNLKPAEYAHRLFDAAYFVRVTAEKGDVPEDGDLDRQVREVFLLADCEPEFIAEALRMPLTLAQKILAGWRQAAKELVSVESRRPATPPGPAQEPSRAPARVRRRRFR